MAPPPAHSANPAGYQVPVTPVHVIPEPPPLPGLWIRIHFLHPAVFKLRIRIQLNKMFNKITL